jgi:hypothetical protein
MTPLTPLEKTALLANAAGITLEHIVENQHFSSDDPPISGLDDYRIKASSLYTTSRMDQMWEVLNWAWKQHDRMVLVVDENDEVVVEPLKYWTYRLMNVLWKSGDKEPKVAVRYILDSILKLAIDAGKIELEEGKCLDYSGPLI